MSEEMSKELKRCLSIIIDAVMDEVDAKYDKSEREFKPKIFDEINVLRAPLLFKLNKNKTLTVTNLLTGKKTRL